MADDSPISAEKEDGVLVVQEPSPILKGNHGSYGHEFVRITRGSVVHVVARKGCDRDDAVTKPSEPLDPSFLRPRQRLASHIGASPCST